MRAYYIKQISTDFFVFDVIDKYSLIISGHHAVLIMRVHMSRARLLSQVGLLEFRCKHAGIEPARKHINL